MYNGKLVTIGAITAVGFGAYFMMGGPSRVAFRMPGYKYTQLELVQSIELTHDVKKYRFKLPKDSSPALPISCAVLVKSSTGIRPFTPIYNTTDPGHVNFAIKNYNRSATKGLNALKPGDKVRVIGPLPHIDLSKSTAEYNQVYLIGAGAGITPLWSFLNASLADPRSETKFKLIYSNKTQDDIIFKDEMEQLKDKYPGRFEVVNILSEGSSADAKYSGKITSKILEQEISPSGKNLQVLVCGPPGFIKTVAGPKSGPPFAQGTFGGILKELGFKKDEVIKY